MSSFDWNKNIEDPIKDALIKTITTTKILYALKAVNVKPQNPPLDDMDIMKLAAGIVGGVLVKDLQSTKNLSGSDTTKFYGPRKGNKIT